MQDRVNHLPPRLVHGGLAILIGMVTSLGALMLPAAAQQPVQAAPAAYPLAYVITDALVVNHTPATTHEMSVFADGRITRWFKTDDGSSYGRNQIDQSGDDPLATTIAVLFDQHPSVDIGIRGDFTPVTPITLETDSTIPGYDEDTSVVYASTILPYQITQRTLATYERNCVVMELDVRNTGVISLTGGKLLYMVDIDAAHTEAGDEGGYDPARRLVYLADENNGSSLSGFAVGISLLQGEWAGYAASGRNNLYFPRSYPTTRDQIIEEMLDPTNAIIDGSNGVVWIVANLPDLMPGQMAPLAFSLCAVNADREEDAIEDLDDTFDKLTRLSAVKLSTPAAGGSVVAGEILTYSIRVSNDGHTPAHNLVISDTVPASTNLISYSVNRGNITENDGIVTAEIEELLPADDPVIMTLTVQPWLTATHGSIISNQAFVQSGSILMATDVVTHQVVNVPNLVVTKTANSGPVIEPGQVLSYTIVVANEGPGYAPDVLISDPLPVHTTFVPGSIRLQPAGSGTQGTTPPTLASDVVIAAGERVTVTFAVTVDEPLDSGTIIANSAAASSPLAPVPATDTVTHTVSVMPAIKVVKTGPAAASVAETVVFTYTVTNDSRTLVQVTGVEDDYAGSANFLGGDSDGDGWLDLAESWIYTGSYTIPPSAPGTLTNTVTVTGVDAVGATAVATASHATEIEFAPVLTMTKTGPVTARIGETVVFTFTVRHEAGSDGSPIQNITVNDDLAGAATRVAGDSNGNSLLDANEVWIYTVDYIIPPFSPNLLINTGTVRGRDGDNQPVMATASHTTTLTGFVPVLYVDKDGPEAARIGQTVVFTFNVINLTEPAIEIFGLDIIAAAAVIGDGSPISDISVSDNVAGEGNYISGDWNANQKLDGGERWIYTASYTIREGDPDPLLNTVTVTGQDQEGDSLAAYDLFSTSLRRSAALNISKTAPLVAAAGEMTVFTFAVNHSAGSDRSPVYNVVVNDTLGGPANYVSGDGNGNKLLDSGETWIYTTRYRVPPNVAGPLVSVCTVSGKDKNNRVVTASSSHSTAITPATAPKSLYLPLIFKLAPLKQ